MKDANHKRFKNAVSKITISKLLKKGLLLFEAIILD